MPMAQVFVPEGVLTLDQKRAMVKGITEVMVRVEGLPASALPYVTVLISEITDGGWGAAGHGYTRQEFPELILKGARTDPDTPR